MLYYIHMVRIHKKERVLVGAALLQVLVGCVDAQTTIPDHSRKALASTSLSMLSPEARFDSAAPVRAYGSPYKVAVAQGAGIQLIVHMDANGYFLRAVRVRAVDGVALDPVGLVLPYGPNPSCTANPNLGHGVAFNGSVFFVTWQGSGRICGVRLHPQQGVVDAAPIQIASDSGSHHQPAVAATAENFIVFWASTPNVGSRGMFAARVRAGDGAVLDSTPIRIADVLGTAVVVPAAAGTAVQAFVTWSDASGLRGARLHADGTVIDPNGFEMTKSAVGALPRTAFDGARFVTVWAQGGLVKVLRAATTGVPLTSNTVANVPGITGAVEVDLAFEGDSAVIVWKCAVTSADPIGPYAGTFKADLSSPSMPQAVFESAVDGLTGSWTNSFAVSVHAGNILVSWNHQNMQEEAASFPSNSHDLRWRSMNVVTGAFKDGSQIGKTATAQRSVSSSFDGTHHLLAWQEWDGNLWTIRGARFRDGDGLQLDQQSLPISGGLPVSQHSPLLASNGRIHLAVWGDRGSLRFARIRGADGAVLDAPSIPLPAKPGVALFDTPRWAVATDGEDFLVVWAEQPGPFGTPEEMFSLRVRGSDGVVLDSVPRRLGISGYALFYVQLAFSKNHYIVSVGETATSANSSTALIAQLLSLTGAPVGDRMVLAPATSNGFHHQKMVVAGDVVWVYWPNHLGSELRTRRVRVSDGTILDAQPIVLSPPVDGDYTAAFDGEHINLVWRQRTSQVRDFRLARITQSGEVLDPGGVVVTDATPWWSMWSPTLSVGRTRILFGHSRFVPDPPYASDRIQWRWIGPPPQPPSVDASVDAGGSSPADALQPSPVDSATMSPADVAISDVSQSDMTTQPSSDAEVGDFDGGPDEPMPWDAGTHPDGAGGAGDAHSPDLVTYDVSGSDTASADVSSPIGERDGPEGDASEVDAGGSSDSGADAGDGSGGLACSCDIGQQPQSSGAGGTGVFVLGIVAFLHRRRRARTRNGWPQE